MILVGLGIFALRPPGTGRILLVPLVSAEGGEAVDVALAHGASLVGTGPLRGSIIVQGDSARLRDAAVAAGVLMIAAPRSGCGRHPGDRDVAA